MNWIHKQAFQYREDCLSLALRLSFLHHRPMPKPFDVVAFLPAAAMMARKAESYHLETYVIDLGELRQIIFKMQHESEQEES